MFAYDRKLQYPVRIHTPDARMAAAIISQYGGPDGELGASLRYLSQRFTMPHREVAGLLTDIGTEELGHLEIVGALVHQLTRNLSPDQVKEGGFDAYYTDHTLGVYPQAAAGVPFTASAIGVKGDPITDLHEDLAAEQKARTTYENLLRLADDPDVKDVLRFLRQREIVHYQRFAEALEMVKSRMDSRNYYTCNLALPNDCACMMPCNQCGDDSCGSCGQERAATQGRCCNEERAATQGRCCNEERAATQGRCCNEERAATRGRCCNEERAATRDRCCNNQEAAARGAGCEDHSQCQAVQSMLGIRIE